MSKVSISIISIMMFVMIAVSVSALYYPYADNFHESSYITLQPGHWSLAYQIEIPSSDANQYGFLSVGTSAVNQWENCPVKPTMYVKYNSIPGSIDYDYKSNASISVAAPEAGVYYIRLHQDSASNCTYLLGSYSLRVPYDTVLTVDRISGSQTGDEIVFLADYHGLGDASVDPLDDPKYMLPLDFGSCYVNIRETDSHKWLGGYMKLSNGTYPSLFYYNTTIKESGNYNYTVRCRTPNSGLVWVSDNRRVWYVPRNETGSDFTISSSGLKSDAILEIYAYGNPLDRAHIGVDEAVTFTARLRDASSYSHYYLSGASCSISFDFANYEPMIANQVYQESAVSRFVEEHIIVLSEVPGPQELNYQINCTHPDFKDINATSSVEIKDAFQYTGNLSAGIMTWVNQYSDLADWGAFSSIAKQGDYLYAVYASPFNEIYTFDVSDPLNIDIVWTYSNPWVNQRLVYAKDNYLSTIYHYGSGNPRMMAKVYDLANPENPLYVNDVNTTLSFGTYTSRFVGDGDYGYLIPTSRDNVMVFDYSNPSTPTVHGLLQNPWVVNDGIYDVKVVDDILYSINSYGIYDAFFIVDISNKNNPQLLGNYSKAWYDEDNTLGMVQRLYVEGDFAYTISSSHFCVFNISNPASISKTGCVGWMNGDGDPENPVGDVVKYGNKVIFGADGALIEADVSDPYNPFFSAILEIDSLKEVNQAVLDGNYLYLAVFGENPDTSGGGMAPQGFGVSDFSPEPLVYQLMVIRLGDEIITDDGAPPIFPPSGDKPDVPLDDDALPFPPPTDPDTVENCSSVEALTLCSPSNQTCIAWVENVNICGQDLASNIIFGDCFVAVNMSGLHYSLNSTTYLLYNNSDGHCGSNDIFYVPEFIPDADAIRSYNTRCIHCDDIKTSNGFVARFNTGHFSSYAIGGNSRLDIYDQYEGSAAPLNSDVVFYANYTNITSGAHVPGATCMIKFDSDPTEFAMTDSGTQYTYTLTGGFSSVGTHQFHVNCTAVNFNSLNTTDDIMVGEVSEGEIPEFNLVTVLIGLAIVGVGVMVHRKRRNN